MAAALAVAVSLLQITSVVFGKGKFDTPDQLEIASEDVQYAFIIFRHGLRSPIHNFYGSEEDFLKSWPDGIGEMTEDGKRLMVHVGQSLRTRYKHLIPDYDEDQVEVTSTVSPRAATSATAVATGMFPPPEPAVEDIPSWQPIPVNYNTDYDMYKLFDQDQHSSMCPRYTKIRDAIIKDELNTLPKNLHDDWKKINKKLKISNSLIKTMTSLDDLFNVWDRCYMETLSRKTLHPWTKGLIAGMTKLANHRMYIRMTGQEGGHNPLLQFFSGPLLNKILSEMIHQHSECLYSLIADHPPGYPGCARVHLHGSHDLTVATLVWALTDQREFMVEPGDALILEMDQLEKVKLLLYSPLKYGKKLQEMSMKPVCNEKTCSLKQLVKGLKARGLILSEDVWQQQCNDMEGVDGPK